MFAIKNASITTKFNRVVIILAILAAAIVSSYMIFTTYHRDYQYFINEGISTATPRDHSLETAIYFHDNTALKQVTRALFKNSNTTYAQIYDAQGKLLFNRTLAPAQLPEVKKQRSDINISSNSFTDQASQTDYLDLMVPVFSAINPTYKNVTPADFVNALLDSEDAQSRYVMGYVRLGLDKTQLKEDIFMFSLHVTGAGLLFVLIFALAALTMTRRITSPLKTLVNVAHSISEGDFDQKLPKDSTYEIKEVATSLAYMLKNINAYKTKLETTQQLLSRKVEERTQQLTLSNKQLSSATDEALKARDLAETANRAKSDFLATMSHEIRTPLNGVLGMSDLLSKTDLSMEQQRFVDVITESGTGLLEVINDILDFSKIEAGKLDLNPTCVNLRRLIEDIINMFASLAEEKGLSLIYDLAPSLALDIEVDGVRLRQVLTNLISNAIKFTSSGTVRLKVSADHNSQQDFALLHFAVEDTGAGIEASKLEHIFSAFSQADTSTTRRYGGTGLGLTISQQLVELMGSDINVDSTLGKGSRFWFQLKVKAQPEQKNTPTSHADVMKKLNLLVIGDNPTECNTLCENLDFWKIRYQRISALNDIEQTLRATETPFDFAFLQQDMNEEVDVLEFVLKLRQDETLEVPAFVLMVPRSATPNAFTLQAANVVRLLNRPLHQSELYNVIINSAEQHVSPLIAGAYDANQDNTAPQLNARILLAEDTVVNQEVAATMLSWLGCETSVVANGQLAVEAFSSDSYDLILMDCQMPVMDGYSATAAIRRHEAFRKASTGSTKNRIPIIALTANAIEGEREKCLACGMDDYLTKPYTHAELQAVLVNALHKPDAVQEINPADEIILDEGTTPEQPAPSSNGVIDFSTLATLRSLQQPGQPDIANKIIRIYMAEAPALLKQLADAETAHDTVALSKAAHALKSSSFNVGALELATHCKELEAIGRSGSTAGITPLMRSIESGYRKAISQLEQELEGSDERHNLA